jgi:hypothetical protein
MAARKDPKEPLYQDRMKTRLKAIHERHQILERTRRGIKKGKKNE